MKDLAAPPQDVMQVCRNGHVITDLLRSNPGRGLSHCDQCGAPTLERCPTCGREIVGATLLPGMMPVGRRQPPRNCTLCGGPFPWAEQVDVTKGEEVNALAALGAFLRRVPRTIRQLRSRHGERPPFRVLDEHDLEDLFRALLPLIAGEVRSESRTPRYSAATRTDFFLPKEQVLLVLKRVTTETREKQLEEQLREDLAFYEAREGDPTLVVFLYDPEGLLHDPARWETTWASLTGNARVMCIIAT